MNDPSVLVIRRALLSVSDKSGLEDLGRALNERGARLLASGGTRSALAGADLPVEEVAEYTGSPEILGGRVKTLHPRIHAGILARRDHADDMRTLEDQQIEPIDLIVVNLYPFEQTIAREDVTAAEAIEQIDIGGPTLIRAAAKNHAHVAVVVDPSQYPELIDRIRAEGGLTLEHRRRLARQAFALTCRYDRAISAYFSTSVVGDAAEPAEAPFPETLDLGFERRSTLRYGENPHQRAAFFIDPAAASANLATATVRHGKELSYNNILDLDSALRLIRMFEEPAACVLKHNNPCGAAVADSLADAFERAYEGDPLSAFGGIVGLNRVVDRPTAEMMVQPGRFLECVIAPGFEPDAFELLTTKPTWKNSVRLIDLGRPLGPETPEDPGFDLRSVSGGLLVQDWDRLDRHEDEGWRVVSQRRPTEAEWFDLRFAWKVCQTVKSNAIVFARGGQIVGVGAGQMSRLDSVQIASTKAGDRTRGAVLASDAFFPFRDSPDAAARVGVSALIEPGGSKRDAEVIQACDEQGLALVFTGRRHFRH